MKDMEAVAIVHVDGDGNPDYLICGDERFRLFVVDERAPNDRVYEITSRCEPEYVRAVMGDSPIGHRNDERHAAIEAVIVEAATGKARLSVVDTDT